MPLPPSRQESIAGNIHDARSARNAGAPAPSGDDLLNALPPGASPANPFASFYECRRKVSGAARASTDASSSITRAYIVPQSLLALARGDAEPASDPARPNDITSQRSLETISGEAATESLGMFRIERALNIGGAIQGRAQRIALQLAAWLRRRRQRSVPN